MERRKEDLIVSLFLWLTIAQLMNATRQCVQTVYPNCDACLYDGTSNRLRITVEGQHVLDQLIVTLLLNLYFRETNMW